MCVCVCVCVCVHTPHLYPFFSWWTFRIFMSMLHTDLKCTDPHVDNHRMTVNQTAILLKRTFEFMVVIMILNLASLTLQWYGQIWRTNVQKYFLKGKKHSRWSQKLCIFLMFQNVQFIIVYIENTEEWKSVPPLVFYWEMSLLSLFLPLSSYQVRNKLYNVIFCILILYSAALLNSLMSHLLHFYTLTMQY